MKVKGAYVPPHKRNQAKNASSDGPSGGFNDRSYGRGGDRGGDRGYDRGFDRGGDRFDRGGDRFDRGGDRRGGYDGDRRDGGRSGFGGRDTRDSFGPSRPAECPWPDRGPGGGRDSRDGGGRSFGGGGFRSRFSAREEAEVEELFAQTVNSGIDFEQYFDIPTEVSGNGAKDFSDERLAPLRENIGRCGYKTPTPVQRLAIPIALSGRDVMSCAQTGSGKTAAFLFPCIARCLAEGPSVAPQTGRGYRSRAFPSILVLAPTRELGTQIHNEARKFCYKTGVRPVVVYGGAEARSQMYELEAGCDLLVATPGRLVDFMDRGKVSLAGVRYLILDEADRMLDMGFEPQIRQIVERSDMPLVDQRRTLLFSATFPREIQRLAGDFMMDYLFVTVGRVGAATKLIKQRVEYIPEDEKRDAVCELLHAVEGLTLVFVETKRGADALEEYLYRKGFPATSIHGDRSQREREEALKAFRGGRCRVLVATDVAARGLDIPHVAHVINFDLPSDIDDYVHRIGRTGRAGNQGLATAFVNERNSGVLKDLEQVLNENDHEVPSWLTQMSRHSYGSGRGRRGPARDYRSGGDRHRGGGHSNYDNWSAGGSSGGSWGGGGW